jgi:glycosidase
VPLVVDAAVADAMRMTFVSNHDKNAWEGTEFEQFGPALEAAIVLSVVSEGIPMIYNGQEAGSDRRLAFFERDPIVWGEHPLGDLYRRLFMLKRQTRALWNGHWGARMIELASDATAHVLSFVRQNEDERVVCAFNLSDGALEVELVGELLPGLYQDFATGVQVELGARAVLTMPPWSYRVLLLR